MRSLVLAASFLLSSFPLLGAITGTVVGNDGHAVAGAKVTAYSIDEHKPLASGAANAEGNFSVDVKAPVVDLQIEVAGEVPVGVRAAANDDAGVLQVGAIPAARGTITAGGKPLAGATVTVRALGAQSVTTTDESGRYLLPDPTRVASHLIVRHPQYAPWQRDFDPLVPTTTDVAMTPGVTLTGKVVAADGRTPVAGAAIEAGGLPLGMTRADGTFTIEHAPAGAKLVARAGDRIGSGKDVIRLEPAATIAGSVRDLAGGMPIAGAEVTACGASAVTDAKGDYAIRGLTGGQCELVALHPNYATPRLVVNVAAGRTTRKSLYAAALGRLSGNVLDDDARAVAGAAVTLRKIGGDNVYVPSTVKTPHAAVTAPDGRFLLRTDDEGNVRLDANKSGFPAGHSGIVRIASGVRKSGIRITIPRGVALNGRVMTADRQPVGGAAVRVAETVVRTKADGTFAMRVGEGPCDITVTAAGFASKRVHTEVSAGSPPLEVTLDRGVEVSGRVTRGGAPVAGVSIFTLNSDRPPVLTGGDGTFLIVDVAPGPVTLALRKREAYIQTTRTITAPAKEIDFDFPAGGRVSGRVIDKATHQPVTAFEAGLSRGGPALANAPVLQSFASDDGTFSIDGAPPATYTLTVNAPAHIMARVPNLTVEEGRPIEKLEVELESGVRVTGHVTGPDGAPAGGVLVRIDPTASRRGAAANEPYALTDGDGEYVLDNVDPGPTTMAFSRGGLPTLRKNVTLSGTSAQVDAQLSAGASMSGVVVLESGAPVANAEVRASSAADASQQSTVSDESGTFTFAAVTPGHYEVTAARNGYAPATLHDVDVPAAGMLRLVMKGGSTITGRITGLSSAELRTASITASSSSDEGGASASPDDSGQYRIDGAPSGTLRVIASARPLERGSRTAVTKSVQVEPGTTANVDFDFGADIVIRGRITRGGSPLGGVTVSFSPAAGSLRRAQATADPNGHYEIAGVDEGNYTVTVLNPGAPYSTPYQVRGSATFDIDLHGATVAGHVSDASNGSAIANATIDLRRTDAADARSTFSDATGAFSFDGVAAGSYEARVRKTSYGTAALPVTVDDNGAPQLDVKLSPATGITITLVDGRDMRPLNGWYQADSAGGSFSGAISGPTPIDLAAGSYRVTAGASGYAARTLTLAAPGEQTIALTPGGSILVSSSSPSFAFVRLLDAAGQPLRFGPGPANDLIRVDPAPGQTRIANVAAGTWTLQLVVNGSVLSTTPVTVREGETVPAKL